MAWLQLLDQHGGLTDQVFEIHGGEILGRASDVEVRLNVRTVARHHGQFVATESGLGIVWLGSGGGIYFNGLRPAVGCDRPRLLEDHDTIQVGNVTLRFTMDRPTNPAPSRERSAWTRRQMRS